VNPDYVPRFDAAGLQIAAVGEDGDVRAMEIPGYRFYIATLFHPQLESHREKPSPLVSAFVNAARGLAASA